MSERRCMHYVITLTTPSEIGQRLRLQRTRAGRSYRVTSSELCLRDPDPAWLVVCEHCSKELRSEAIYPSTRWFCQGIDDARYYLGRGHN